MRSLRARFFLISWPLVVVAVLVVVLVMSRWTQREIERFEIRNQAEPDAELTVEIEERVLLPDESANGAAALKARARQALWATVLAASAVAALAALLLAQPLVAQVGRLRKAAERIGRGELEARVSETSGDELGQLERSFNAMAEALEAATAQQKNLVSDVAHELRTPLTNLVGLLEAIDDGLRPADRATLASLREEVDLLTSLVAELQELALAESGQLAFELESLDAMAAARAAVEACRGLVAGQELDGPDSIEPLSVRADRRRLSQVLRNLIKNALTHTPAKGSVRLSVEKRGGLVAFVVRDTGGGIPAEHLPLIWRRFYRVDPSRQRSSGGMGLGLAVAQQLVAGMGGTVQVESREGSGSTFTVMLPAEEL